MKCDHSHLDHLRRSTEERHQLFREEPEYERSDRHDSHAVSDAEAHCLLEAVLPVCTVVVCDDRHRSVVHSEYRHEYKALQLEVDSESRYCKVRESCQDLVDAEVHQCSDRLQDYGRDTDPVYVLHRLPVRSDLMERQRHFLVEPSVEHVTEHASEQLTEYRSDRGTFCPHPR